MKNPKPNLPKPNLSKGEQKAIKNLQKEKILL